MAKLTIAFLALAGFYATADQADARKKFVGTWEARWKNKVIWTMLLGIIFSTGGLVGTVRAQSMPGTSERFEVASIRPSGAQGGQPSFKSDLAGGIQATNVTLKLLIQMAYDIRPEQLSGGPAWTDSEEYTVIAKGPEGDPVLLEAARREVTRERLQALLSERFHLTLKLEVNAAAGYVLRVDRKGHKMTLATDTAVSRLRQIGLWELLGEGVEMPILARFLGAHLQATVEDGTGLAGHYNFHLKWTPDPPIAASELPEESLIPASLG
jgi:bla regulator protein BlaR1